MAKTNDWSKIIKEAEAREFIKCGPNVQRHVPKPRKPKKQVMTPSKDESVSDEATDGKIEKHGKSEFSDMRTQKMRYSLMHICSMIGMCSFYDDIALNEQAGTITYYDHKRKLTFTLTIS